MKIGQNRKVTLTLLQPQINRHYHGDMEKHPGEAIHDRGINLIQNVLKPEHISLPYPHRPALPSQVEESL